MNRALVLGLLLLAAPARAGELTFELRLDPAAVELREAPGGLRVRCSGYSPAGAPGQPALPVRAVRLALPPGVDPTMVTLELEDLAAPLWLPLAGRRPAPAPAPRLLCPDTCPGSQVPPAGPDPFATGSSLGARGAGRLGAIGVLHFLHRPFALERDALVVHPHQRVRLRWPERLAATGRAAPLDLSRARRLVDNPEVLSLWPSLRDDPGPTGVAIVTTEALATALPHLPDYLAGLEARGLAPVVVTESDFDTVSGPPPDGRAQRIRAWLQAHREEFDLGYALLLGNPDTKHGEIPMLATYPYGPGGIEWFDELPTDAYYSDLTGNWDVDGDGLYGEFDGDGGPGGVDFYPELAVGRLPVYGDPSTVDELLARATAYPLPRPGSAWRRRLLVPGSIVFFDDGRPGSVQMEGGDFAEYMRPEFEQLGWEVRTLYEADGLRPSSYLSFADGALNEEAVIAEWNTGFGIVFWFGHGSEDAAFRTIWATDWNGNGRPSDDELSSLPFAQAIHYGRLGSERPAFVFHGSCSNGTPEAAGNIAYTLLKSGAIGTFASSRVALGGGGPGWEPNPASAEMFTAGYYTTARLRDGATSGEALADARALLRDGWWGPSAWHTKFGANLTGDPTLALANCRSDADCDDSLSCNGLETCQQGQCAAGLRVDCSQFDSFCTRGECREPEGTCERVELNGRVCDDGLFCTVGDRCQAGTCQGSPRACEPLAECHQGVCDEQAEACGAERLPDGERCDLSTGEIGECLAGRCLPPADEGCGCRAPGSASGSALGGGLLLGLLLARRRRRGK